MVSAQIAEISVTGAFVLPWETFATEKGHFPAVALSPAPNSTGALPAQEQGGSAYAALPGTWPLPSRDPRVILASDI
jgi:hypothetical protein